MKNLALFFSAILVLSACSTKQGADNLRDDTFGVQGICVIHDSPLREKPTNESDIITSLYLGDQFLFLGEEKTDINREYYKIELVDGTRGWLQKKAVLFNAKQAAVIKKCTLYQQFESLKENQETLNPAEYVAILKEEGDWAKVVGANREKEGWTKKENLSTHEEDIFIATIAYSDLLDRSGNIKKERLPYFLQSLPDKNAPLALVLKNLLEYEVETAIAESILYYETEYYENEEDLVE